MAEKVETVETGGQQPPAPTQEPAAPTAAQRAAEGPTVPDWARDPDRAYAEVQRTREEAKRYREELADTTARLGKLESAQRQADMSEVEKLRDDLTAANAKLAEAEVALRDANIRAHLKGEVADEAAAAKLLEDSDIKDDGTVDLNGFLDRYPFMRPGGPPKNAARPGSSGAAADPDRPLTAQDFVGKDPAWVLANRHRLGGRKR